MNKKIYFFSILLLFSLSIIAQNVKVNYAKFAATTVIDISKIECVYEYSVTDPILKKTKKYENILQIGDKFSKYWCYTRYKIDSVVYTFPDISKITTTEALALYNKYKYGRAVREEFHKNRKDNSVYVVDRIPLDTYVYEESLPEWNWILSEDTLTVCGHLCNKATTTFRGRDWTAWYSEDIPEDNGPWKLGGLPGLILKVEDSDKEHVFEATLLRKSSREILRNVGKNYLVTTRERFLKEKNLYEADPRKYLGATGAIETGELNVDEKPKKRFYNQIERE